MIKRLSVNSFAGPNALAYRSYVLLPLQGGVQPTDLEFQEYSGYVATALAARGFRPAPSLDDAQVVVFLDYGMGEPREHSYTYDLPIWGQTGVKSSQTTSDVSAVGNTATIQSKTTYKPEYGVTGYTTYSASYTTFTGFALLSAVDVGRYKADRQIVEVWKTRIACVGKNGDLRGVFPAMIGGAWDLFAKSTGRIVERSVSDSSREVVWIRNPKGPGPIQGTAQAGRPTAPGWWSQ